MAINNKKWTYEIVKQMVEEQGYELIEFFEPCPENNHKPKILISNGYEEKLMYFDNFRRGKFKLKPNTLDVVKSKVEEYYNISLDNIKCIKQFKRNQDDVFELTYKGKTIVRTIGSLYNSIQQGNNIFTETRKKQYDYAEVYELLSNPHNKIDSFEILYDGEEFKKNNATFVLTIKGVRYTYKWRGLIERLSLVTEHSSFTPRKSNGELKIMSELCNHNIEYITEKAFIGCTYDGKHLLRFDFYLPKYNICIEYDGEHHYKDVELYNMKTSLDEVRKRDEVKNQYCIDNGIKLVRIPYYKFKKIPQIIQDIVSSN